MSLTIWIGGIDRSTYVQPSSLEITDDLNARNTLRCTLRNTAAETTLLQIDPGEDIIAEEDGSPPVRLFAGTVDDPHETVLPPGDVVDVAITAVDYNQLADRFLVAEVYENQTIEAITTDLITQYLAAEGVTIGHIEPGATITRKLFSYVSLAEALNWISEQTGYTWEIDYYKVFRLRAPDTIAAPFVATGETVRTLSVRRPRGTYRNRQYIRGGKDLTDLRSEFFSGDGTRRTFTVAFPIGLEPTVTVNTFPQTVGIRGVETDFAWYWNKESNEITQDNSGTILVSSDQLRVTYRGLFPILVQAQDDVAIAERVTVEGGSGIYEAIESEGSIDDADLAFDTALAKLQREGMIREYVELVTDEPGLRSGQLLTVIEPTLELDGTYLVQSVYLQDVDNTEIVYHATLLSGDALGGWITWFQRLMAVKRLDVAEDTESLLLLRVIPDVVRLTESLVYVAGVRETRIGYARIGQSEIGEMPDAPLATTVATETLRSADTLTAERIGAGMLLEAVTGESLHAREAPDNAAQRTAPEFLRIGEAPDNVAQLTEPELVRISDSVEASFGLGAPILSASATETVLAHEGPEDAAQLTEPEFLRIAESPDARAQLTEPEFLRIADATDNFAELVEVPEIVRLIESVQAALIDSTDLLRDVTNEQVVVDDVGQGVVELRGVIHVTDEVQVEWI